MCITGLLNSYSEDITEKSRFVAFGFDDGRNSDFKWVAPLFTKYNAHATFNIINMQNSAKPEYIEKVNRIIADGHDIGDHTILHRTYVYELPFCNGQPEENYIGNKGIPSNDDMRKDIGNGKNIFNIPVNKRIKDSPIQQPVSIGISDIENKTWMTLTDEDCQKIRNYFSVWNDGSLNYLDELSAIFCGTTGSSKAPDSWNGKEFIKGIFTDCKTTSNHEIWDRMIEIQTQWYTKHYNLKSAPTNWSLPGGQRCSALLYFKNKKRYFDKECSIPANSYGKCMSTRTGKSRSWADLLRENNYKTSSDSLFESLSDDFAARNILVVMPFNANLCKNDSICRDNSFDRIWLAPSKPYDPKREPLANSTDWLKTIYETDANFKKEIDKLVRQCSSGRIAFGLCDSSAEFGNKLVYELCLQFCQKANIKPVSMKEAYEIAYKTPLTKGNLFRNPNMDRDVYTIIGATNATVPPDGWTAGCVRDATPSANGIKKMLCLDSSEKTVFFLFGIPLGNLNFSFLAIKGIGNSKLTIKKLRNIDPYLNADGCPILKEITIDNESAWKKYSVELFLENAPSLPVPSEKSPTCDGLDNKICGLAFVLEGKNTRFATPSLTVVPSTRPYIR